MELGGKQGEQRAHQLEEFVEIGRVILGTAEQLPPEQLLSHRLDAGDLEPAGGLRVNGADDTDCNREHLATT